MTHRAGVISGLVLLTLAALCAFGSSWLNSQRPALVNVRWAPATDAFTRAQAEHTHGLDPRREVGERTWEYYLTDVSRANVERIVRDPAVEDTHFINRVWFRIARNATRGPYPANWHARSARAFDFVFGLSLLAGCLLAGFGVGRVRQSGDDWEVWGRRVPFDMVLLLILIGAAGTRLYLASTLEYIHDEDNTAIPLSKTISFMPGSVNLPLRGEHHGALPAYIVKASAAIFGTSPLGYRTLHVVLGLCTVLMVFVLTRNAYGRVAARWAAALMAFNEYFLAFSSRVTANTPYLFFVTAAVLAFSRFLVSGRPLGLYGAGVATALAFYCKEHAALLLPIFAVVVLVSHRRWLWTPHPYLASVVVLLLIAPDLWWNATADPETVHLDYTSSYVAQSTYAAHLRRVGGIGLSPYPAMFYAREPVAGFLRWATGQTVPDVAGYPALNPVLGILLVTATVAATFGQQPRVRERSLLLILAWGIFLFFTLIRRGDPPNRLMPISWLWVESTLIPAVVLGGAWLSKLRGRGRATAWIIAALALFYAVDSLLRFLTS